METFGADRELALLHMPGPVREAFRALFSIDLAMADVVARATEPNLARIKLAWWREQLEALDSAPPPAEPRLKAAAEELLPRGVAGAELAKLETGWAVLLDERIEAQLVAERGSLLFTIGGRLLGSEDANVADAGALYALAAVGRRGLPEMFEPARAIFEKLCSHRFRRNLRPLTMLARAAARDLRLKEPEGSRARLLGMLAHRWSGRIS